MEKVLNSSGPIPAIKATPRAWYWWCYARHGCDRWLALFKDDSEGELEPAHDSGTLRVMCPCGKDFSYSAASLESDMADAKGERSYTKPPQTLFHPDEKE